MPGKRTLPTKCKTRRLSSIFKIKSKNNKDYINVLKATSYLQEFHDRECDNEDRQKNNKNITNPNVMKQFGEENNRGSIPVSNNGNDKMFEKFLNLQEIQIFLRKLENDNPQKVKIESVGNSTNGNPIILVRICEGLLRGDSKTATMIEAGSNGTQLYTVSTALYLIDFLINSKSATKSMDYLIMPCTNPDAYVAVLNNCAEKTNLCLSNNFPITLGLTNIDNISTEDFLDAAEEWKENYKFGAVETQAIIKVLNMYEYSIKLFISLQENGEKILYPYGFSDGEHRSIKEIIKVAKSGQSGGKQRCFNIGSIYEMSGLTFGNIIDFVATTFGSVEYAYIVSISKKCKKSCPDNIKTYGEEIANIIKYMVRGVKSLMRKQTKHSC